MTLLTACARQSAPAGLRPIRIQLNWVAEPEFGGLYEAQRAGAFRSEGLEVTLIEGGPAAPVMQSVASGQVDFGIVGGDDLVIARSRGIDVVAVFATFQSSPLAVMVHAQRGIESLEDLRGGTLAMEPGLPFGAWLRHRYSFQGVTLVPYDGGIARFLKDPNHAQQCYVTSEPLAARREGASPRLFPAASTGFDPYTNVVVTRGSVVRDNRDLITKVVRAISAGWAGYLRDPAPANGAMGKLNHAMSPETFAAAAEAQRALIQSTPLGTMNEARWTTLIGQLTEIKLISTPAKASDCFYWP